MAGSTHDAPGRGPEWLEAAQAYLLKADPTMAALVQRQGPVSRPVPPRDEYFARLVRAIVAQQISGKAAASIFGKVVERTGTPITPAALYDVPEEELRGCGLSNAKMLAVRDLAARALDDRLDLRHLAELGDDEVREQLVAVRGIGRWTADMFLMFVLARPDVLPAEDLGIQNAVKRLYALEAHPAPAEVRRLAAEGGWHPYATAASFHLWDSLD